MDKPPLISFSIVSHGQADLIVRLLADIERHVQAPHEVLLTLNLPEELPFDPASFRFPVRIILNPRPKGFGANHNAALAQAAGKYCCILNPDIRFDADPLPALLHALQPPHAGVAGPVILSPSGGVEDSARRFPTPFSIIRKAMCGSPGIEYAVGTETVHPDWIAGMFMVLRAEVFRALGGFDESYFLYYEDVDLCWRLRRAGFDVLLVPAAHAVHDARRASHSDARYRRWHLRSMLRFFLRRSGLLSSRHSLLKS